VNSKGNKMNERILEQAFQAEFINKRVLDDSYVIDDPELMAKLAKFAELIVREMLVTCEEHPAWTGRMISEQIKQHFGVEE